MVEEVTSPRNFITCALMLALCARLQMQGETGFATALAVNAGAFAILAWRDNLGGKWPMNAAWWDAPLAALGVVAWRASGELEPAGADAGTGTGRVDRKTVFVAKPYSQQVINPT